MTALDPRQHSSSSRRIQLVLLLLILWDALAIIAELSFGNSLFEIDGDQMDGVLATKASLSGAALAPLALYLHALVRGPARHWGVLWIGVVEQGATALFSVYHVARDDVSVEAIVIPMAVSLALLVLIFLNLPRSQPAV